MENNSQSYFIRQRAEGLVMLSLLLISLPTIRKDINQFTSSLEQTEQLCKLYISKMGPVEIAALKRGMIHIGILFKHNTEISTNVQSALSMLTQLRTTRNQ